MQGIRDLTQGPISKQLFRLAMPILGTSFIQMAYTLTDMAWVGRLGSRSVAAIGAVGILIWLTNSVALLNKVSAEVSVGQSIGGKNFSDARSFSSHNLTLGLLIALVWGGLLFSLARPAVGFYGLDNGISAEAVKYLRLLTFGFPFIFLSASFTGIHNASGLSRIPFYINGAGLGMNILLDPLFIFGLGWGTAGAACATILSQATVCGLFIYQVKRRNRLFGGFPFFTRLSGRFTKRILRLGLPVALLNGLFAIINLLMGRTASLYGGHIGLTTLTTGGQIEALAWSTSQGLSTALSAFVAQNFAAGRADRVRGAYHAALAFASLLGLACTLLFVFYGKELFSLIVPEREAYLAGAVFLRIDGYSMMLMMAEITIQGLFYGSGRTLPPALISIGFNLLRLPLAILLASTPLGVEGVWWAISITSAAKGITALLCFPLTITNYELRITK